MLRRGDSLGPRVGTLLQNKMKRPLLIYGYEGCNVNAQNLVLAYDMVKSYAPGKTDCSYRCSGRRQ